MSRAIKQVVSFRKLFQNGETNVNKLRHIADADTDK